MGDPVELSDREQQVRRYFWACIQIAGATLASCVVGLVIIVLAPWESTIPLLWAMACTASGTIVGFVLVAPRRGSVARGSVAISHGSIDRLQDWVLGLVVGVTLLQAREIPGAIRGLADSLALGIVPEPATAAQIASARAFAVGVIVYFFTMGVIGGALVTRYLLAYLRNPLASEVEESGGATASPDAAERPGPKIVSGDP